MVEDLPGKDLRLGGGDKERIPLFPELRQGLRDIGIDPVLELPFPVVALPVEADRLLCLTWRLSRQEGGKALEERWTDAEKEIVGRWNRSVELLQGVLDAAGDAEARIGEGAVEIEENIAHGFQDFMKGGGCTGDQAER